jgi:hypothetical protein
MDLSKKVVIHRDPETVWKGLWNIEGVAGCIEGCKEVEVIESNKRYGATVVERVGPFLVSMKMEIDVVESEENLRLAVEARGTDGKLGTRVRWRADVGIEPEGDNQTAIDIRLHTEVRGKIASLGEGLVKRKVHEGLEKFTSSFAQMIESES